MKSVFSFTLLASVALASPDYESMFKAFKDKHTKVYASVAEEARRFEAFTRNMKRAAIHQSVNPLASFGANIFSDRTEAELKSLHPNTYVLPRDVDYTRVEGAQVSSIDWRNKGAVGPVLNLGVQGGDWAISAAGNIEGVSAASGGNAFILASVEELIACSGNYTDGIGKGLPMNAFQWLVSWRNGTIASNASFPYDPSYPPQLCPADLNSLDSAVTISSYTFPQFNNETAIADSVVSMGPISVLVDATSWEFYVDGIMTNCVSLQDDLAVLIVGFDDNNVPPYWIVKNAWGVDWGEEGYIRIAKGSNQCLIASFPSTVVV